MGTILSNINDLLREHGAHIDHYFAKEPTYTKIMKQFIQQLETCKAVQGDSYYEYITIRETDGALSDISAFTSIVMEIRKGTSSNSTLVQRFTLGNGIVPDAPGIIKIIATPEETILWETGTLYRAIRFAIEDIEITRAAGSIVVLEPPINQSDVPS